MSVKNMLFLFIAFLVSFGINHYLDHRETPKSKFVHLSSFSDVGPSQRVLKVKMKMSEIASDDTDIVTIKSYVSLPFHYDNEISYKWMLGDHVELVSGLLEGKLKNFKAQEPQVVEIKVRNFSQKNLRHVAFRTEGHKDGKKISADSIVASDIEKTFEDVVKNVERLKQEEKND